MTRDEIREMTQDINERIVALSAATIDAIDALEATTEELNIANGIIESLGTQVETLTEELRAPSRAPRTTTNTEQEISMDFQRQPVIPENLPRVRFLSRTSAMGGLANVRAAMNDVGINVKRLRLEGSTYTPTPEVVLINWGGGFDLPTNLRGFTGRHLNKLDAVKIAASKLKTFQKLENSPELENYLPEYTTEAARAADYGWQVTYVRETLYGHSGDGIRVINAGDTIPSGLPLYVEGLNVRNEYRVHTVNGFTKIQKKARLETENPNMEVRNLEGGWTFINEFTLGDQGRSELHDISIKTIECLGLDFGAVDIVRTDEGNWKILEVNTAPGVTADSNIEWYTKALLN